MENMNLTEMYENLPKIVKFLLQLFLGYIISGVYRVLRFLETKNIVTLIVGLVGLLTGFGNVIVWLLDLYTVITKNRICILAD